METEEIDVAEYNKIISDFVGLKLGFRTFGYEVVEHDFDFEFPEFLEESDTEHLWTIDGPLVDYYAALKFNTCYRWIMPVLTKIEELGYVTILARWLDKEMKYTCDIYHIGIGKKSYNRIIDSEISKIDAAWKAVVEFIKWYNASEK